MYKPLYSMCCGEVGIGDRTLEVCIVPRFVTTIRKHEGCQMYWLTDKIMKFETYEEDKALLDPGVQWLVEVNTKANIFHVFVLEYTKTIQTPFEEEMNQVIQRQVKKAQKEYRKRKQMEKRLYFYNSGDRRLNLYVRENSYGFDQYRYQLNCFFIPYQAIDKRFPTPKESCFILGKIRRTIGTKDGNLMSFIEPIAEFKLDENERDYCGDGECQLGNVIFEMLEFSILKNEPSGLTATRIQRKMKCSVQEFIKKVNMLLEEGDAEKVKDFYNVINKP